MCVMQDSKCPLAVDGYAAMQLCFLGPDGMAQRLLCDW